MNRDFNSYHENPIAELGQSTRLMLRQALGRVAESFEISVQKSTSAIIEGLLAMPSHLDQVSRNSATAISQEQSFIDALAANVGKQRESLDEMAGTVPSRHSQLGRLRASSGGFSRSTDVVVEQYHMDRAALENAVKQPIEELKRVGQASK